MKVYSEWKKLIENVTEENKNEFEQTYYKSEENLYKKILAESENVIQGKFGDIAKEYGFTNATFAGFMEGVNESLIDPVNLEDLKVSSDIILKIDFEKLYLNMLKAKADWLYNLPEWDGVLTEEKRHQITKDYHLSKQAVSKKIGRNDPCLCGSGKKYKKCCGK